jgi:hypothetical protein
MLNYAASRVALLAVLAVTTVVTTGACGARPSASVGDPVILAAPAPAPNPKRLPQTSPQTSAQATTTTAPSPTPDKTGRPVVDPALVEAAARQVEPNTTLGAVILDQVSGATSLSVNANRQFSSASLVKLMIAIDALDRGASETDRERLSRMLSVSDDDLASSFWVEGGPGIVPRVVALVGLEGTEAPELPGRWGEVKVTPNDMVRVYMYILHRMPDADRSLIVDALAQAPEYAADEFDQYFGIPDGLTAQWAIKQGWGNNDRTMVLHSTGLVGPGWRYVVILLTEHPLGSGWRTSANSVTAAARELEGKLPDA